MEWSSGMAIIGGAAASAPARRCFSLSTKNARYEVRKSVASIGSGNNGGGIPSNRRDDRDFFSDRDPGQGFQHGGDGFFRSVGSRSTPSRPSIPGRFSKYSKNESFRKISSPTKRPPALPPPPSYRGYHSGSGGDAPSQASTGFPGMDLPPRRGWLHEEPDQNPPPRFPEPDRINSEPSWPRESFETGSSQSHPAPGSDQSSGLDRSLDPRDGDQQRHWSRKHLEQANSARRIDPPPLPRQHLELPVPKYPNRLQMGYASRGIRSEPLQDRPRYEVPFEFQYTYSEVPKEDPIAERGPNFSPFGPDSMPRPWTGKKPLPPSKKKQYEIDSFNPPPPNLKGVKPVEPAGPFLEGQRPILATTREEVIGDPLTKDEIGDLVVACNKEHRQVNIGRDGVTHNMLDLIHSHWKRRRVIKLKCKGVPSIDVENVCFHLEDKTGGKIIQRHGGSIYLFRGRNYNPRYRPEIPLMMWKPPVPIYPRLIQQAPGGLSVEHAEYLRRRGRRVKPLTRLARNGVYMNLVNQVRSAFEVDELVRIDCRGMNLHDIRKIGAKLKEILGIVLLSFEDENILMWRGPPKQSETDQATEEFIRDSVFDDKQSETDAKPIESGSDGGTAPPIDEALLRAAKELEHLWDRAINFGMVTTLEDDQLDPDTVKSLVGAPPTVRRMQASDEAEANVFEVEDRRQRREELLLQKRLNQPLTPPEPCVGVLPVDELAKLLASPPR